jgi:phosphoribosylaminoimidazole-succinocarboxamide synthase
MPETLFNSELTSLPLVSRGKVRDIYGVGEDHLLIVTTDRLSLTAVSNFWFERTRDLIPNHLSELSLEEVLPDAAERAQVAGRAIVVRKLAPLPVEAIVRGYIVGSGWKDYQRTQAVCGIPLPAGLHEADKLPEPLFTPSTKAELGAHDENISFERMIELVGRETAERVRDVSIAIYTRARDHAETRGIIVADTKFEFGRDKNGELVLIDEAVTPDSSRFWPMDSYAPGSSPPSFDKQFVRDYLETLDWDKTAPGPELPDDIAAKTAEKYREAQTRLIGAG